MVAGLRTPPVMTVAAFLAWDSPPGQRWQLIDGVPQAMAPASRTHNTIQGELGALIRNHLRERGGPCEVVPNPGIVPRARAEDNFRVPDLAVTCTGYQSEEYTLPDPVLLVEILAPSNQAETWANIWAYTTIPSVREILVVSSTAVSVQLLRRGPDGSWPDRSATITDGDLTLDSIGFTAPLRAIYRGTRLVAA